jgi:hypothetical protein
MKFYHLALSVLLAFALCLSAQASGTIQSKTCPSKYEAYADAVGRLPADAIQKTVSYSNLFTEVVGGQKKENWVCIIGYEIPKKNP